MEIASRAASTEFPTVTRLSNRPLERAPAEFLLAAACCRWPRSEERTIAIREAAARPIDWEHFLRVVTRHRVWGLVDDGLRQAEISPPPEIARALRAQAALIIRNNLRSAAECLSLQRLFNEGGIRVVFVKGTALAMLAYSDLALKHGKDIDLLVSPADLEAAMALLEGAGYALSEFPSPLSDTQRALVIRHRKVLAFRHRKTGSEVELHWKLSDNPFLLRGIDGVSALQSVRLADGPDIQTLAREELLIYLCTHGAGHAWHRLKWLADFGALLTPQSDADLERLYLRAKSAGAACCVGQALLLCERLLGIGLPSPLATELRRSRIVTLLEEWALGAMLRGSAASEPDDGILGSLQVTLPHLLLGDSWRGLLYQLRCDLFGTPDIARVSLPPPLHFMYPVMRFPSWLWRRVRYRPLEKA